MPMFEVHCAPCNFTEEHFVHHWDTPIPCSRCGGPTEKLFSNFAAPFMGSLRKYTDLRRENSQMEGFWAYRKRSSASGQPEPCYISDMQQLKEFNKAEGLAAPGEVPTNCTISPDGRRIESRGMPGQWAGSIPELPSRMREMIATPAAECVPPPATARPAMPADYGVRIEVAPAPPEVAQA